MKETMDFTNDSQPPNPDADCLGAIGAGGYRIGYVDEVNGPGAVEVEGFIATEYELLQLVKHWASVTIEIHYDWFIFQSPGSSDIRREPFARRRIARIAAALGDDKVDRAIREARDEFGKGCDQRIWNIYLNGTPEEREALQKEIQEGI